MANPKVRSKNDVSKGQVPELLMTSGKGSKNLNLGKTGFAPSGRVAIRYQFFVLTLPAFKR